MASCSIDGCSRDRRYAEKGWCQMHYHRWWRHGDPLFVKEERVAAPTYRAVHMRLSRKFGPAATHVCDMCGSQAHHWAYDGSDPQPMWATFGDRTIPYSYDQSRYRPLCRGCHVKFDRYLT